MFSFEGLMSHESGYGILWTRPGHVTRVLCLDGIRSILANEIHIIASTLNNPSIAWSLIHKPSASLPLQRRNLRCVWVSVFTRIFGRISYQIRCSMGGSLQNIYKQAGGWETERAFCAFLLFIVPVNLQKPCVFN